MMSYFHDITDTATDIDTVVDTVWYWLSAIFPILAVAFVAFCIWLCVRIVNRRERWAKRLGAGIACLPFLYVLSFGPACWLIAYIEVAPARPNPPTRALDWISLVYSPFGQINKHAGEHGPACIERLLSWYAGVGIPTGKPVLIPLRPHMWIYGRDDGIGFEEPSPSVNPPGQTPDAKSESN